MFAIVDHTIRSRTNEFLQSEDANSVESHEDINVDSKFLQVLKLSFEIKNSQMEQIPSKTKKKIKTLEDEMKNLFQSTTTTNVTLDDIIVLAIAYLNMGLIYVDSNKEDELRAGKDYFMKCIELLKGKELDRKAILTSIEVYTKLQCILNKLQKPQTSELLYEAMELYLKYTKEEDKYPNPINIPSILGIEKAKSHSRSLLTDVYLTTVDYLVKRYTQWPKNDENDKLVIYIHNLLNKAIPETMKFQNLGCCYWAFASIDLTRYFLFNHRFTEARHHLAAADYIMEKFHKFVNEATFSEYHAILLDKYQDVHANIARYWASYGSKLLCLSKEKLFKENEESCKTDNSESLMSSEKNITNFLLFTDLEKDLENITSIITDTYVSNTKDAKKVFVNILKWLNTAKLYFTIEKDFVIYGQILLEISKAYKYLAYFEHSTDNLMKQYKWQIKHLENAIKELHPKAKEKRELNICRYIYLELGIVYSTFARINTERLEKLDKSLFIDVNKKMKYNVDSETFESMKNAIKHLTSFLKPSS